MVKYPNSKALNRDLENGKTKRIYLFMGEEIGEKDKAIGKIIDLIFKEKEDKNNSIGRFYIDSKSNVDEFMNAVDFSLSQSMFSSKKLAIIRNIENINNNKANKSLMEELIETLSPGTSLIMTTLEKNPSSLINKKLHEKIAAIQFWKYFDNDIFNYITMTCKKNGIKMDDRAISLLIEKTGKDIKKIDEAMDIINFSGRKDKIDYESIQTLIYDVKDVNVFEFIDSLFKREKRSFSLLKKLLEEGMNELPILYQINRQAELIEKYHFSIEKGFVREEALKECKIYPRQKDNFLIFTRNFSRKDISRIFPLISAADLNIKSQGKSKELLSNHIINLISDIQLNPV